jgi:hypothetical protein
MLFVTVSDSTSGRSLSRFKIEILDLDTNTIRDVAEQLGCRTCNSLAPFTNVQWANATEGGLLEGWSRDGLFPGLSQPSSIHRPRRYATARYRERDDDSEAATTCMSRPRHAPPTRRA